MLVLVAWHELFSLTHIPTVRAELPGVFPPKHNRSPLANAGRFKYWSIRESGEARVDELADSGEWQGRY